MKLSTSLATDTPVPRLALIGVLVILTITVLRCTTVYDDFPAWSSDPLQLPTPIIGVTPVISMTLDLLTLLGCIFCLIGSKFATHSPRWMALLAIGCAAVAYHIFTPGVGSLDNSLTGMHLTASIASAIAIAAASWHPRIRMLVLSALTAVVILLAFKGLSNYFIEQPEMAQMFAQEKDRYIAAQGWTPGSANALAYERRLIQREATGWFGLSNVYASVTGAGLAIFIGLLLPALRPQVLPFIAARTRAGLFLCVCAATLSLVLAGSKGGTAAAFIGVALSMLGTWAYFTDDPQKPDRALNALAARTLGLIIPIGVLGLVAVRGLIGERIGELSILFRWFYMQAATRIYADNALLGVGPGGFKDAYMLAKNPLSPEDVISPHSIFFDLAATLGLGGIAFGIILLTLFVGAGKSLFPSRLRRATQPPLTPISPESTPSKSHDSHSQEADQSEQSPLRMDLRLALSPIVIGVLVSAWLEQQVATPSSTLVRLGGLFISGLAASIISQYSRHHLGLLAMSVAAACGAFVIIAHSQIEMTLTTSGASLWACVLLGLAAVPAFYVENQVAPESRNQEGTARSESGTLGRMTPWATSLVLLVVVVASVTPWLRTWRWEALLRSAANAVAPSTQFHIRASALTSSSQSSTGDSFEMLIRDLEEATGSQVPRNGAAFSQALFHLRVSSTMTAFDHLEKAAQVWPTHLGTSRVASRLAIANYQLASNPEPSSEPSPKSNTPSPVMPIEHFDKAIELAANLTKAAPTSPAYSWLATLLEERYRKSPTTAAFDELSDALKRSAALAPYEPVNFQRLAVLYATRDPAIAAEYATRAFTLNANLRLDPLRQFSETDLAKLESIRSTAKGLP